MTKADRNETIKAVCFVLCGVAAANALGWKSAIQSGSTLKRLFARPLPRAYWERLRDDEVYWIIGQFVFDEMSLFTNHTEQSIKETLQTVRRVRAKRGCPDDINDVWTDRLRRFLRSNLSV